SVLFPLSNVLVKVIPLDSLEHDGALHKLTPSLITTLATITTLFLLLWTFSTRSEFKVRAQRGGIRRQALLSFGLGLVTIVVYLVGYHLEWNAYGLFGWESEDLRHLLFEIPLMVAYVASFALVTRAFVLLGMMEFFSGERRPSNR